ncbi:MAG: ester cyclase [Chloroflexi bacterium]|nr:ester cyclase [Chloroflexota bacterium]
MDMDKLAKEWLEAFNRHDFKTLAAKYDPNVVYSQPHTPQPLKGKEGAVKDLQGFVTAFPDARMEFTRVFNRGNSQAVEWVFRGTHKGPLPGPAGPIPPTNRTVQLKGVEILEVNTKGLITQELGYFDQAALMYQLGLMPT